MVRNMELVLRVYRVKPADVPNTINAIPNDKAVGEVEEEEEEGTATVGVLLEVLFLLLLLLFGSVISKCVLWGNIRGGIETINLLASSHVTLQTKKK
jgi:hypothetical protein